MPPPLSKLGENATLARLLATGLPCNDDLLVGPGDDCAVVRGDESWDVLLKTDVVVEGLHFLPGTAPARVGHKALARAISDIAAMGGLPTHALVTLLIDPQRSIEEVEELYRGMNALADRYGISLAGGECSSLPQPGLIINIALTGKVERGQAILRSGGKPGDIVAVTGPLGGSFARGHHLDFEPRVELARQLAQAPYRPHAMMDLSDGLAVDLPRLAAASQCSFELQEETLPCQAGCTPQQAMGDGEDYELLLCYSPDEWQQICRPSLGAFLHPVGKLQPPHQTSTLPQGGWQHF